MYSEEHLRMALETIFSSTIVLEDIPTLRILNELRLCETNDDVIALLERLCARLTSYYLESVIKEPHLVREPFREIPVAPVEITGLSLPGTRYFQTSNGQIFQEGTAINANMSVLSIGALGIVFSTPSGKAVTFLTRELAWQTN